jgi:type II pantothenate kinase
MRNILESIESFDEVLYHAYKSGRIIVVGTGSSSPCLNLHKISSKLVGASQNADLVVLEVSIRLLI